MKRSVERKNKKRKVKFSLDVTDANEVYVVGDFNAWKVGVHPMKKNVDGKWEKQIVLPEGQFEYKFKVDEQWITDPNNVRICSNCFGTHNNVVNVIV